MPQLPSHMPPLPSSNSPIEKRFFSITEVAAEVGENASVLRYWEKEFRQLNPRTNARGKRFYTRKEIDLIGQIRDLVRGHGFTLDGARRVLNGEVAAPEAPAPDGRAEALARLQRLRERVLALQAEPVAASTAPAAPVE